jgi:isopenicillin N synthase-like dioxygenase
MLGGCCPVLPGTWVSNVTSSPTLTTRPVASTRARLLRDSIEFKDKLDLWRAGAHTAFDCLILLFLQDGQGGLQVCPGKEVDSQE